MPLTAQIRFARLAGPLLATSVARMATSSLARPAHRRRVPATVARTAYDPFDPAVAAQPHAFYRELLDGPAVHYNARRDIWVVSHYAAVRAALRSPELLSSADGVLRYPANLPTMLTCDRPRHADLRKIGHGAFTRPAVESWQPVIDELATELVADVLANPERDVVEHLAIPMPVKMIAHLLGISAADYADFRTWSTSMIQVADVDLTPDGLRRIAESVAGLREFHGYLDRRWHDDDLVDTDSVLARAQQATDDGTLDADDLFYFATLLMMAGNETTTNLISTLILSLAEHPDQFELLRRDPTLIPGAVEEAIRHSSPVQGFFRTARADYEVDGTVIPGGARVLLLFGAANRDPRQYADPDRFQVERDATGHLGFGNGIHLCLGAPLARNEGIAVLRELVKRVERIDVVGRPVWTTNSNLRGLSRLPVTLVPAGS